MRDDIHVSAVLRRRSLRARFGALTRSVSFWLAVALVVFLVVQALGLAGPSRDDAGAGIAAGWIAQALLVSLFFEAITRRIAVIFVCAPLLFYCGYYSAFFQQGDHVERRVKELARTNPTRLLSFDPETQALALDNAEAFVVSHRLPVAYAALRGQGPKSYLAFRLAPAEQAAELTNVGRDLQVLNVIRGEAPVPTAREIRHIEVPEKPLIAVSTQGPVYRGWDDWSIGVSATHFEIDGRAIGDFRTGYVMRLPRFPVLQFGCEFDAAQRPACAAKFFTYRQELDTRPANVDLQRYGDPVGMALAIEIRTAEEIAHPARIEDLHNPAERQQNPNDPGFALLARILAGRTAPSPWSAAAQIGAEPERLAPVLGDLVSRLENFGQKGGEYVPYAAENRRFIAFAISSARTGDLERFADRISPIVRADAAWKDLPDLYLRAADLGPGLYSFYRDRLLSPATDARELALAAAAICRIGFADSELATKLRSLSLKPSEGQNDDLVLRSAAFVALKKIGREPFMPSNAPDERGVAALWFAAVLAGSGETSAGPNNCMPLEWPYSAPLPKVLTPTLVWTGAGWEVVTLR